MKNFFNRRLISAVVTFSFVMAPLAAVAQQVPTEAQLEAAAEYKTYSKAELAIEQLQKDLQTEIDRNASHTETLRHIVITNSVFETLSGLAVVETGVVTALRFKPAEGVPYLLGAALIFGLSYTIDKFGNHQLSLNENEASKLQARLNHVDQELVVAKRTLELVQRNRP